MKLAAGIMSGTSLDGIDVVLAYVDNYDEETIVKFLDGITIPWTNETYNQIKDSISLEKSNVELISKLNYKISHEYYSALNILLERNKTEYSKIDFIAMHGQTIWHDPNNNEIGSTLQIGSGSVLSALTKTTVISNFRSKDLVVGGQGAPLVPFADKILFNSKDRIISAHNLGGISNLTLLKNNEVIYAYDTGPANMMIDYFMKKLFNKNYDKNGEVAFSGSIIKPLYEEVMSLNYFSQDIPKSTGRELFGDDYCNYLLEKYNNYNCEDYIHTLSIITVDTIVNSYKKIIREYNLEKIIFSGGGTHNAFIIKMIKQKLPTITIEKSSKYGVSIDFKEALAFVILGNQTYNMRPSNFKKLTGSDQKLILGDVSF